MDGLAKFEKSLVLEKSKREEETRRKREKKRRHHHRSEHRRDNTDREKDEQEEHGAFSRDTIHRDERSRRQHDDSAARESNSNGHPHKRPRHHHERKLDKDGDSAFSGEKDASAPAQPPLVRDSWMTTPAGVDIDYVHRHHAVQSLPSKSTPRHKISERELNSEALQQLNHGETINNLHLPSQPTIDYTFGDEGSEWRMTRLDGVYTIARETQRSVDEVAIERYGGLREFDAACEEKRELERRKLYGEGYAVNSKPTGILYQERLAKIGTKTGVDEIAADEKGKREEAINSQGHSDNSKRNADRDEGNAGGEVHGAAASVNQTALNRLRAQLMKAKLRNLPNAAQLEASYAQAVASFSASGADTASPHNTVVLDVAHSRMLAGKRNEVKAVETRRGKERGLVKENEDMTVEDMVREEQRTKGVAGGEGFRLAERIARDAKFDDDLDYLDENADKLSKHVHKSEASLKHVAVHEYTKMNKILESCPLCHHEDRKPPQDLPLAPIVSLATRVYITLPTEPELTGAEGGAVIVPIDHHTNLLECDDYEWEELRNFMKSLTRMYHDQGRDVIFYENAAAPHRRLHAALVAVPIPYELGDTAPAFFREAMLSADEEWSQHKKVIDTGKLARNGMGKAAFRKSIAKEMPYFHAWFTMDGGLGHIVEDAERWPRGDLFAREIVGGMLDVDASIIKRQGRWMRNDSRLDDFRRRWRRFDWTRVLVEG